MKTALSFAIIALGISMVVNIIIGFTYESYSLVALALMQLFAGLFLSNVLEEQET